MELLVYSSQTWSQVKAWTVENRLLLPRLMKLFTFLLGFLRQLNPITSLTIGLSEVDVADIARNLGV